MEVSKTEFDFDIKTVAIEDSDYKQADIRMLGNIVFQLYLIREFENTLLKLSAEGCLHGPVHTSIGEEACAAGAMATLKPSDKIASTHRAHHHYLAKLINYYAKKDFDAAKGEISEQCQQGVITLMGEVMGLSIGCCKGRGGSMHLRNPEIGVIGTSAIVAGGVPIATGAAFASKYNKTGDVVVCFLGDGAVNQGAFHEAVNLGAIWKLPIIYFIENNQYAVGTFISTATATKDLASKASAYGIPGRIVDGMNPLAVMLAMKDAVDYVRSGSGAIIVEAKCYRYHHHAGPLAGSNYGYRTKEEEQQWRERDPVKIFPEQLVSKGAFTKEQIDRLKDKAIEVVRNAADYCTESKDGKLFVKQQLWPKVESIEIGLRSDGHEFDETTFVGKNCFTEFVSSTYVGAIAAVTGRHLERDQKVFVMGEEIANFGGGPYGATKGLPKSYPDRVLNTPISEAGFTGLAGGAAMCGLKPIVEIMFPDFSLVAADQLFNQIGRLRHMYGNTTDMPLVVRTRTAIGCGYGGQHSMDPAGLYSLFSGWRVVAPSNAFDYIGLFNSAMRSKDPVLVLEHHSLYPKKSEIPKDNLDYFIKIGTANVIQEGKDLTVLCYSSTVDLVMQAVSEISVEKDISVEVIDLRTISPKDIDYDTIGNSLKKTGVLTIVEQAPLSMCIGHNISYQCQQRFFDYINRAVSIISGMDIPNPVSKVLEDAVVPSVESIKLKFLKIAKSTS